LIEWGIPSNKIIKGRQIISGFDENKQPIDKEEEYYYFSGIPEMSIVNTYCGDVRLFLGATRLLERLRDGLENGQGAEIFQKIETASNMRELFTDVLAHRSPEAELAPDEIRGILSKDGNGYFIKTDDGRKFHLDHEAITDFILAAGESKDNREQKLESNIPVVGKIEDKGDENLITKIYFVN